MRLTDYEMWIQAPGEGALDAVLLDPVARHGGTIADPPADFLIVTFGDCEEDPTVGDRWLDEFEFRPRRAVLEPSGMTDGLDEAR